MFKEWLDKFFFPEEKTVFKKQESSGLVFSSKERKYQDILTKEYKKYKKKFGLIV